VCSTFSCPSKPLGTHSHEHLRAVSLSTIRRSSGRFVVGVERRLRVLAEQAPEVLDQAQGVVADGRAYLALDIGGGETSIAVLVQRGEELLGVAAGVPIGNTGPLQDLGELVLVDKAVPVAIVGLESGLEVGVELVLDGVRVAHEFLLILILDVVQAAHRQLT
jgi:hypothetical protein